LQTEKISIVTVIVSVNSKLLHRHSNAVTISTRLMKVICSTLLAGKFAHMGIYLYR